MLDIIAFLSRQQINTVDAREDETVDVLNVSSESVTATVAITGITKGIHPVKWGSPTTAKWSLFTWG